MKYTHDKRREDGAVEERPSDNLRRVAHEERYARSHLISRPFRPAVVRCHDDERIRQRRPLLEYSEERAEPIVDPRRCRDVAARPAGRKALCRRPHCCATTQHARGRRAAVAQGEQIGRGCRHEASHRRVVRRTRCRAIRAEAVAENVFGLRGVRDGGVEIKKKGVWAATASDMKRAAARVSHSLLCVKLPQTFEAHVFKFPM